MVEGGIGSYLPGGQDIRILHWVPNDGNIAKMTITWGKIHKYLGMAIVYYSPGKVIFSMVDYIVKMIDDIS